MFPDSFDYERATTVEGALDRLASHAEAEADVELLAGGHSLVPAMKTEGRSPDVVVDLAVDALDGVDVRDDHSVVGALTTYADLADSESLRTRAPVVPRTAAEVGDLQIRNRGTVGGNLAEAHPAADPPAAVLAADADVLVRGPDGQRDVPAADFFRGDGETAVGTAEILTGVRVPHAADAGAAYAKKTHPATGYAMVGVAAVVDADGDAVTDARVAATGVQDAALRLPSVEAALVEGGTEGDSLEAAAAEAVADVDESRLRSDAHASGAFRTRLLETYTRRALEAAVERAAGETPTA